MEAAHDPVVGMAALLVFWLVGQVLHLHVS